MVPHLVPKTPGTQKLTKNVKSMAILGFLVKEGLNVKTDRKFGLKESFNQKQISG